MGLVHFHERSALASKKFIAYLIAELTWKVILGIAVWQVDLSATAFPRWWLLGIIVTAGFVEIGFIGGQAWLDKYVRVAHVMASAGKKGDDPEEPEATPGSTPTPEGE